MPSPKSKGGKVISYDDLQTASDWADSSEHLEAEAWAEAEGINGEEMIRFCAEQSLKTVLGGAARGGPVAGVALGMIMGIRMMNLVHRSKNPDLEALKTD